ncbi:aminoglycoside phosphotransferase [Ameyamaea chiangmaiensis NBRC 103196]|uniref:Hydroxylysine kinase n=1 Tax=Ameyamaea chiangmaiensis TaxID=442969 RepID=A0A850P9C7_9PROT|nr:phosphotransferase [Ameyamaea chiangmaiensis]MBS4073848.1 phosphotransferase [Ameyamaea chiangmaiensis]NVN40624.1 phosphotransferase [Ameyamaea chiangmaiensis]GBQ68199.1 aminoglycoside phosphotransferase [Ameyamaea chiangmaiensis NBRC 103196]
MKRDDLFSTAIAQLTSAPPAIPSDSVRRAVADRYGLEVSLSPLPGERDLNFQATARNGDRFALKIINANETAGETALLTAIMTHVDTGDVPVAPVIRDRDGRADTVLTHNDQTWRMRLVGWLDGLPLAEAPASLALCRDTGRQIARVATRLRSLGTDTSASRRRILWDSSRVDELADFAIHIGDPHRRTHVLAFLAHFASLRRAGIDGLRRQVIHNDYNASNITVVATDPTRVAGLVDFGDACEAPLVNELAVAASYQMCAPEGPIASLAAMAAGFHAVTPLTGPEIEMLLPLVQARLATRLILGEWRASLFPDNVAYIRRSIDKAVALFDQLRTLSDGTPHVRAALAAEHDLS